MPRAPRRPSPPPTPEAEAEQPQPQVLEDVVADAPEGEPVIMTYVGPPVEMPPTEDIFGITYTADAVAEAPMAVEATTEAPVLQVCPHCERTITEDNPLIRPEGADAPYCNVCVLDDHFHCENCGELTHSDESYEVYTGRSASVSWCETCNSESGHNCDMCGNTYSGNVAVEDDEEADEEGVAICEFCHADRDERNRIANAAREARQAEAIARRLAQEAEEDKAAPKAESKIIPGTSLMRIERTVRDSTWRENGALQIGKPTDRFSERPIGVEFETDFNGKSTKLKGLVLGTLPKWGCHSDGSISGDEYVTAPISGHHIEDEVTAFYHFCKELDVRMANPSVGMHVHVHSQDIWAEVQVDEARFLGNSVFNIGSFRSPMGANFTVQDAQDALICFGSTLADMCRLLVGAQRGKSGYCSAGFGVRDKGPRAPGVSKLGTSSYPTIAVRNKTMEFRVWPGTDILEKALSRIELSQRAVDMAYNLIRKQDQDEVKRVLMAMGDLVVVGNGALMQTTEEACLEQGRKYVNGVCDLFALSDKARERHLKTIDTIVQNVAVRNGLITAGGE